MRHTGELVVLLDFAVIGALPRVFFRRGSFNARWCLTAMPFALAAGAVVTAWAGTWEPWVASGRQGLVGVFSYLGVGLAAVSLHLIGYTIGVNRVPLALWHQDDDSPVEIVTWGPYAWVRHPFYTAFLATFLAAACVAPGMATIIPALLGAVALAVTARREERRLLQSQLGATYARYSATTGRFLPHVGRIGSVPRPAAPSAGRLHRGAEAGR